MMEATTGTAKRKSIKNVNLPLPLPLLLAASKRRKRRDAADAEDTAAVITGDGFSNPWAVKRRTL
ncbi:hypothetical protein AS030_11920 [Fictibacillus enclensis]|uniref:Uncharacterized protein n=1 Tax=Fictibacillus enclensis TaxID=1017270 RepID=A0A0V8J8T1_9BACL|nr:hypothetical protein AS030_11920 [Fictibacillus enclensis]